MHLSRTWTVAATKSKGVESRSYLFKMDNGLSAAGTWFRAIPAPESAPATVVLHTAGIQNASDTVAGRVNRGEQVLAADLVFGTASGKSRMPGSLSRWFMLPATAPLVSKPLN